MVISQMRAKAMLEISDRSNVTWALTSDKDTSYCKGAGLNPVFSGLWRKGVPGKYSGGYCGGKGLM